MTDSKFLKVALSTPLKEAGFRKKSDTWYWSNEDVILVVNLQKSQYGAQFYVNCGVALKALGAPAFPKEYQCHIRFRLSSVSSDEQKKRIESVFDLEDESLSDKQRENQITEFVENIALPLLQKCSSLSGIAEAISGGMLVNTLMYKEVERLVLESPIGLR